ncbi:hypothetical protein ACFVY0_40365 [Streptomyces sp. NPDC058286]|uniref:hypothetical protein n=1 Tax=Streptomyces sp. NPDC058286 TaxID=3346422 RepID=UPI0036E9A83B
MDWEFVEAIADICSANAAEQRKLLDQVRALPTETSNDGTNESGQSPAADDAASDLVAVQQRSLLVSDKLLRAMERAAELERERNSANQLVLLLLTMVETLRRNIDRLTRARDVDSTAAETTGVSQPLRERLTRSEGQRLAAETELERARAERDKADQLHEAAEQQVRMLTAELSRLRGEDSSESPHDPGDAAGLSLPSAPDPMDAGAADIDIALAKASRVLDDGADRLDRLADELRLDKSSDKSVTWGDNLDISEAGPTAERTRWWIDSFLAARGHPEEITALINSFVTEADHEAAVTLIEALRANDFRKEAERLLDAFIEDREPAEVCALVVTSPPPDRARDTSRILAHFGITRTGAEVITVVQILRSEQLTAEAYQLLVSVGRGASSLVVGEVMGALSLADASWVLDAAKRSRPLEDMPSLEAVLRSSSRVSEAQEIQSAYHARLRAAAPSAHEPEHEPQRRALAAWPMDLDDDDEEEPAEPAFQVYSPAPLPDNWRSEWERIEGGIADVSDATYFAARLAKANDIVELRLEHRRMWQACRTQPRTLIELAARFGMTPRVTQALVTAMLEEGTLAKVRRRIRPG